MTKKIIGDNIVEIQSGGKVMEYWVSFDIKIERTHKINSRYIVLTKRSNNQQLNFTSILTERGFN